MAKRLGRPPAGDSEVTRQRIIEAAQRHFGEHGYERATNGDIARELDLTSGSIYHHFGSKGELYMAVCDQTRSTTMGWLEDAVAGRDRLTGRLQAVLDSTTELHHRHPALAAFMTAAPIEARHHPELQPAVTAYLEALSAFLTGLVDEAVAAGELSPEADPQSVVRLIQAMMFGLAQFATAAPAALLTDVLVNCERLIDGALFTSVH